MMRFRFISVLLLIIIAFLFFGLIKNKLSPGDASIENRYIISQSKDQKFSLSQKDDNIFTLYSQVADGTHSQIIVYLNDKADSSLISQEVIDVGTEETAYDFTMPDDESSIYMNIYYNDHNGIAICSNAINLVNDNGDWSIAENANTEANSKIVGKASKNDFLYSDSELDEIPQGIMVLSDTITKAHTNDYDKAYALYIWLAEHIYMTDSCEDKSLEYSYNTRICDNETYANLYAAMLRVQDIPCTVTECDGGYVFNEVYADGRWLNTQIDRDTFNKYSSHKYTYTRRNLYTHFDIPTDIISVNYIVTGQGK